MRRTRFMSMMFLVLSLAFFCVKDFRWAFGDVPLASRFTYMSGNQVRALARQAAAEGDSKALVFAALDAPGANCEDIIRTTDNTVAQDASLTWIYYQNAEVCRDEWTKPAIGNRVKEWIAKLEAYDHDNAVPALLQAEFVRVTSPNWPQVGKEGIASPDYLTSLAAQQEWRQAMARAYAAPRYDNYALRRFELERQVMWAHGWATPIRMVLALSGYMMPNLVNVRDYANLESKYLGPQAEAAKHPDEALALYRSTAGFGRLMQADGKSLIEQLIGVAVERIAAEPNLIAALKKSGHSDEAALEEYRLHEIVKNLEVLRGLDLVAPRSNHFWAALLVRLFGVSVLFFGALTLLSVLYVNAKRWIRRDKRGRIFKLVTVAENYLPVLLFLGCMGLYLIYAPYAYNFRHYMTATGKIHSLEPIWSNIYPFFEDMRNTDLPLLHPFGSYVYWALAGLVLVVVLAGWEEWRVRRQPH
jgi:hypothetical protein